jgi:hypothetical protein
MDQFRLLSSGWGNELDDAVSLRSGQIEVICPFIKMRTAERLLAGGRPPAFRILTRFDLKCFNDKASDIDALRLLLDAGASIRGVRGLHSKLYLFGNERVIVTSANLTEAAMTRNHEFGFVSRHSAVIAECAGYFEQLWGPAGGDLERRALDEWRSILDEERRRRPAERKETSLPDFGIVVELPSPFTTFVPAAEVAGQQAFLKFFGTSANRANLDEPIADIVERSECTWACTYPPNKRPRQVEDGDEIFMAYLITGGDLRVFGRAIGRKHRPGLDEATEEEMEKRDWKREWPIYVRVHSGRFLNGPLANGISVRQMMGKLGSDSYRPTQQNALIGKGNIVPSRSIMQKAHMQLTPQSAAWLGARLEDAFRRHGELHIGDER